LTVKGGGCQKEALNGHNWGLNGRQEQRTAFQGGGNGGYF
jgi:hypothetical protein